jgi:DNA (cytosine-5)-methyltransferase 1
VPTPAPTPPPKPTAVELFAGVGGFALGLESRLIGFDPDGGWRWAPGEGAWQVAWANQWEPSTRHQHAADGYRAALPEDPTAPAHQLVDADIDVALDLNLAEEEGRDPREAIDRMVDHALDAHVPARGPQVDRHRAAIQLAAGWASRPLPDHIDLLVGGFPCQDYSVAKTLKQASGIVGRKGVLWWQIERILRHRKPTHVLLENVDRLLKSPTTERGRDFAIMLATFAYHGYEVEWRVINAAAYGYPQRRRRVFIYARHLGTSAPSLEPFAPHAEEILAATGLLAEAFPCDLDGISEVDDLRNGGGVKDPKRLTDTWGTRTTSPWPHAGYMRAGHVLTARVPAPTDTAPQPLDGHVHTLGEMLLDVRHVLKDPELHSFLVPHRQLDLDNPPGRSRRGTWHHLKGPKDDPRVAANGHVYRYSEGGVAFPEPQDRPARTIVTGEGGSSPSRFKLVVKQTVPPELLDDPAPAIADALVEEDGEHVVYRRLTPTELERINMFEDGWTAAVGSDNRRAFTMGNALVVGIVARLGDTLAGRIRDGR